MGPVLLSLGVISGTSVAVGRLLGYRAPVPYLLFWLLALLLAGTSWNLVTRVFGRSDICECCVRLGVTAFAVVVLCGLVLGLSGRIDPEAYLAAELVCFVGSCLLRRSSVAPAPVRHPALPTVVVAIIGALLAFSLGYAVKHAPLTLYDSVSYHLFFSARWLQAHRLSIIPTPFSDEAQAYAPANGELYFLWLMAPFHGDLLARFGQWPFALLDAVALYAITRRVGALPQQAIYPAAFLLLSHPVMEQAVGADVDLICASLFLASIYFTLIAVDRDRRRDWLWLGITVGLYLGTKYLALLYLPVLLLAAVGRGVRRRGLWALPGLAMFGAPWYLRNWIVAGSPVYPMGVQLGSWILARGAFTTAAEWNTAYHLSQPRLLPVTIADAFGPTLLMVSIPLVTLGLIRMVRRRWWPHRFLVLAPLGMLLLFWYGVPMNANGRYLMPAVSLWLLPLAFIFRGTPRWDRGMRVWCGLGMIGILVGMPVRIPAALPWFMSGWLALHGLVEPRFVVLFVTVAALVALAWKTVPQQLRWSIPLLIAVCASSATVLAYGGERWCVPSRCDYLETDSPHIPIDLIYAWRWVDAHVRDATVAYTGNNLPYPLTGTHLTNRVVYVNIDGHLRWRFDNYAHAYQRGLFVPFPPRLATSSGELMPVGPQAAHLGGASHPRYERMEGDRALWLDNLQRLGVTQLFVSALLPDEVAYQWHDPQGFPIENAWAQAEPGQFTLEFANPHARMYAVHLARIRAGP